jgi:hypothetical protein
MPPVGVKSKKVDMWDSLKREEAYISGSFSVRSDLFHRQDMQRLAGLYAFPFPSRLSKLDCK